MDSKTDLTQYVPVTRKRIKYSPELADKVAEKIASGYTLQEIANKYDWAPKYSTLVKYRTQYPYCANKFEMARTEGLESRKRDEIDNLYRSNLDAIATDCALLPMPNAMQTVLFKAKVDFIYKRIEYAMRELEIELPDKYGKWAKAPEDLNSKLKTKSLPELQNFMLELLETHKDILTMPEPGTIVPNDEESK